jgi:hypothetical protein
MRYVLAAKRDWRITGTLALLALGCGTGEPPNQTPPPDANAVDDASASDLATDGPLDGQALQIDGRGGRDGPSVGDGSNDAGASGDGRAPVYAVQCGASLCDLNDAGALLHCCSTDLGVTGTCVDFSAPCGNPYPFYCGGPENCVSSASCCAFGGGSSCLPIGSCPGANGSTVCHSVGDCAAGEACCPLADASSFRICKAGPCG